MMRRSIAVTLVLTTTWLSTWAAAPGWAESTARQAHYDEASARVDYLMSQIEELRSSIDRSEFDLEALLEKLDFDAESIIRFVQEEIDFELYSGVLRGAQGTLMSKAGNSLDQSILLATLLRTSGYDVRIQHGSLTEHGALDLRNQMLEESGPLTLPGNEAPTREQLDQYRSAEHPPTESVEPRNRQNSGAEAERFMEVQRRVEQLSVELKQALSKGGIDMGEVPLSSVDLSDSGSYFWVESKLGPSDPWIQIHPAFNGGPPPSLEAKETLADTVPESLQHLVTFQVFIEQSSHGKVVRKPIMAKWIRPAANVYGEALTFSFVPIGLSEFDDLLAIEQKLATAPFMIPVFNGSLPEGAMAVDRRGFTVPVDAVASPASGLFSTFTGKTDDAVSALGGLGSQPKTEPSVSHISRMWIEYGLIAPGGRERYWQRNITSQSSPNTDGSSVWFDLSDSHTVAFLGGRVPSAFVSNQALNQIASTRTSLEALLAGSDRLGDFSDLDNSWPGYLSLLSIFDQGAGLFSKLTTFRPEPTILVHRIAVTGAASAREEIDIVNNRRIAITAAKNGIAIDRNATLMTGIWETLTEGEGLLAEGVAKRGFDDVLQWTNEHDVPLQLITDKQELAEKGNLLPGETKNHIGQELDAGFLVVVPERFPETPERTGGWWRIDPDTGTTVGTSIDSRGSVSTEEVIVMIFAVLIGALLGVLAFGSCVGGSVHGQSAGKLVLCGLCGLFVMATAAILIFVTWEAIAVAERNRKFYFIGRGAAGARSETPAFVALAILLAQGVCDAVGGFYDHAFN